MAEWSTWADIISWVDSLLSLSLILKSKRQEFSSETRVQESAKSKSIVEFSNKIAILLALKNWWILVMSKSEYLPTPNGPMADIPTWVQIT